MANFNSADEADELFADFGSLGLWYYDNNTWTQVSGLNPEGMISATLMWTGDDELVVDFGSVGLWYWDDGTWTQLSGVNPEGMFAVDDDGDGRDEIQVDFGALGIWRYDWDTSTWEQYSGLNPLHGLPTFCRNGAWGREGIWTFSSVGIWSFSSTEAGGTHFNQLTGTCTSEDALASANITNYTDAKDLVVDFASLGLWLFKGDQSGWVRISAMNAKRIKEVEFSEYPDYELLAEDSAGGLYWGNWICDGMMWTLITNSAIGPGWCETFDMDGTDNGDEEVFVPWSAGGASIFDYNTGVLTHLVSSLEYVNFAVRGDYYGRGYDSSLALAFSSASQHPGLWLWDATAGFVQLSSVVPDGIY